MARSRSMVPVALLVVGSILLITGSVVGAVSGTSMILVSLEGIIGLYSLGFATYLYRDSVDRVIRPDVSAAAGPAGAPASSIARRNRRRVWPAAL